MRTMRGAYTNRLIHGLNRPYRCHAGGPVLQLVGPGLGVGLYDMVGTSKDAGYLSAQGGGLEILRSINIFNPKT